MAEELKEVAENIKQDTKPVAPKRDPEAPMSIDEINRLAAQEQLEFDREERIAMREERRLNLSDLTTRVADRKNEEEQKKQEREAQGRVFNAQATDDKNKWKACSHKKGGKVSATDLSVLSKGGTHANYAVIKHRMINSDLWVRCLRCARTWLPPIKENFYFEVIGKKADGTPVYGDRRMPSDGPQTGTFLLDRFELAEKEYKEACNFPTNNTDSASVQVRFSDPIIGSDGTTKWQDANADFRKTDAVKNTNLR
jgi:hypothetical protein